MTGLSIAGAVILGIASNLFVDTGIPLINNFFIRLAARLRYRKDSARAEVWLEELSAFIDERPGRIHKLATSSGILAGTVAGLVLNAFGRQFHARSSAIYSAFLIAGISVAVVLATVTRSSALWWSASAALFLLLLVKVFIAKSRRPDTSINFFVERIAASIGGNFQNLGILTAIPISPLRVVWTTGDEHSSVEELLANGNLQRRIAIVGPPGAGKTNLLYELAQQLLEQVSSDANPRIPIVLHARDWDLGDSLTKWLTKELSRRFLLKESVAYRLVLQGGVLLLMDGLDELPYDSQSIAAQLLNDGLNGCKALSAVITCRAAEFESLSPLMPGFVIISVLPLTDADVRRFLDELPPEFDRSLIERTLELDPTLRKAAKDPLLLRLLTYALSLASTGSVPSPDPAWSVLALGADFARRGDLENALHAYEAAGYDGRSFTSVLADIMTGYVLALSGKPDAADIAFQGAKTTYGQLVGNLSIPSRSGLRIDEDQLRIIRSLRIGITYDDGQISSASLLPPGAVQRALSSLKESGLVTDDQDDTGRRWRLTEAALSEKALL